MPYGKWFWNWSTHKRLLCAHRDGLVSTTKQQHTCGYNSFWMSERHNLEMKTEMFRQIYVFQKCIRGFRRDSCIFGFSHSKLTLPVMASLHFPQTVSDWKRETKKWYFNEVFFFAGVSTENRGVIISANMISSFGNFHIFWLDDIFERIWIICR